MLTRPLTVTVPGTPATKGSMKCVGRGTRHQLVDSNVGTKVWMRTLVAAFTGVWPVEEKANAHQAVRVSLTVVLDRPQAHYTTKGLLTRQAVDAVPAKGRSGDIDKHARAVLDALQQARVLNDDAQVVALDAEKVYATDRDVRPGVMVCVEPWLPAVLS